METTKEFPEWEEVAEQLRLGLGYSDITIERTRYTYRVFTQDYCSFAEGNTPEVILKDGIERVNKAYENKEISKDKLLRIRRLAFRLLQLIETGSISRKAAPVYGKRFGNLHNEALLSSFVDSEKKGGKHAGSIIYRDENIIRQFILFIEENGRDAEDVDVQEMLDFLAYMKKRRPAGIKSVASALRHFYLYLVDEELVDPAILLAIKPWGLSHKKVYGILSQEEKKSLLDVIDDSSTGKRDKAFIMLAMDCGLRSSDICHLKLNEIDWRTSSVRIVQQKTQNGLSVPFSTDTGNALADYILNARGKSELPYVFLKKSYCDTAMTSSMLCTRLKKHLDKAGIKHPKSEKISMHTFRRSLGTALINSGEDLEMVAQVLGHKDKEATKLYISISEKMLRSCPLDMPGFSEGNGGAL